MKGELSQILWSKITTCWNLQEAVNFIEYRRRMPTVSPMCFTHVLQVWPGTMAVKEKNHPYHPYLILDA